jgi:raffinose/stachyose/melibiose transport system permease protein
MAIKRLRSYLYHLFFVVFTIIWVYPFLWMISSSFKSQSEMFLNGLSLIPIKATFENYARAWEAAHFYQYFVNTVVMAVSVVLIVLIVTSMSGFALGRGRFPGRKVLIGLLAASAFMPKGYTILPLFKLIVALGLNNTLLGVILAESGGSHVLAIMLFLGFFMAIPKELEESAIMDGAGLFQRYARIMLPLSKPIISTVAILNFVSVWNSFLVPLVLTLNAPHLRTLGVGMYAFNGEHAIDWTGLAAGACMSVIPIIAVFLWLQKYFIAGLAGAVKG